MHPASWEVLQGNEGAADDAVLALEGQSAWWPQGPPGASAVGGGRVAINLFFPWGTVPLVPLCLSFSQWARFWQAGVELPILRGDKLFTAAQSSQAGLAGPPLRGTLRLSQVKNPLFLCPPFIRGAKEV